MSDSVGFVDCANNGSDVSNAAQLVDINCANPDTPLQARLCVLMSDSLMVRQSGERLYTWANRIGLPSSTMRRILDGTQVMQRRVAERVSQNTGANIDWLINGKGEAFDLGNKYSPPMLVQAVPDVKNDSTGLDLQVLEISIETLEAVLEQTRRKMSPKQKSHLILAIYQLYANAPHPDEMRPTIEMLIRSAA